MRHERTARPTLTVIELDPGDEVDFRLAAGGRRRIRLERAWVKLHATTLAEIKAPERGARTVVRMHCGLRIDGDPVSLVRWIGDDRSFYEPWELRGIRLWFDSCSDLAELLNENHGACLPAKRARLALQDASLRICPTLLHPWCPLPAGGLTIAGCYDGDDCWCGPYHGADAHGGLDINHPAGTVLWAPLAIDEHGLFDRVDAGANNNRWRGLHRWPDGSTWVLQSHHLIRLLVPEDGPIPAGTPYAESAGVHVGMHEHSHFVFAVIDPEGTEIRVDPWILFWQMYRDRAATLAARG